MSKHSKSLVSLATVVGLAATFAGCAGPNRAPSSSSAYPMGGGMAAPLGAPAMAAATAVQVPSGHVVAMETTGTGEIVYECREKTGAAGSFEWVFVGPTASLADRQGRVVGRYFGPPATWAASDGSAITGAQLAVAPAGDGNLPQQLVKAAPATGSGMMSGVSYVQRLATRGGVAPSKPCQMDARGQREMVRYQADYIFWMAA